jgi:hypothetical protein
MADNAVDISGITGFMLCLKPTMLIFGIMPNVVMMIKAEKMAWNAEGNGELLLC